MASYRYMQQKRKRASDKGRSGVEGRRKKMIERASEMIVVATVTTSGTLGEHTIELLDCGEPMMCWVIFDGEIRRPRTARGFVSLLGRWLWRKVHNEAR